MSASVAPPPTLFGPRPQTGADLEHRLPVIDGLRTNEVLVDVSYEVQHLAAHPRGIIPGYEEIRFEGVVVGHWRTGRMMFGDENDNVVAARMALGGESMTLFVHRDDKAKWLAFERQKRCERANPEEVIEAAIADELQDAGHRVQRQVRVHGGRIDILDRTGKCVIECKAEPTLSSLFAALEQLERYAPFFPDYALAVGIPEITDERVRRAVERYGVRVFHPAAPSEDSKQ